MSESLLSAITSIRFDRYKSFDNDGPYRVLLGQNVTLFIGRNNSGKSSLVDIIECVAQYGKIRKIKDGMENICPSFILDEEHIKKGFSEIVHLTNLRGSELSNAIRFCGDELTVQLEENACILSSKQEDSRLLFSWNGTSESIIPNWNKIVRAYNLEFNNVVFRRINAERDIVPEMEWNDDTVDENGNGATNLIRRFINTESYNEEYVEKMILLELNKIMEPDAHFDRIRVQQVREKDEDEYCWEIFLEENGHRYAMSKSGSGLKTILLILINLFLIPQTTEYEGKNICYAFEEIENNLHPALQRRVFEYLYKYAVDNNVNIFISSHSHIAINVLFGKNETRLYHVIKENGHSRLLDVDNNFQKGEILDDLDVKASDLFQTNGIIWVEGPSDRIYILHWLKIFTDFSYVEGLHFQFMYYGGRLLAHYEADEQEKRTEGLINVLTINRHGAIVMDSDKTSQQASINDTKKRIKGSFEEKGLFCWITKGKEIENYVSAEAVNATYKSTLPQIGKYEKFPDYILEIDKYFENKKTDVARKMCNYITVENSRNIMDLQQQIEKLYEQIKEWNKS